MIKQGHCGFIHASRIVSPGSEDSGVLQDAEGYKGMGSMHVRIKIYDLHTFIQGWLYPFLYPKRIRLLNWLSVSGIGVQMCVPS